MDKVAPRSDLFQLNRDRAAPLLKKLRADGIGHLIDGKTVPAGLFPDEISSAKRRALTRRPICRHRRS